MLESGRDLGEDELLRSPKLAVYSDFDKKGETYARGEAYGHLLNASGLCYLYTVSLPLPLVELLAPATGWDMGWAEGLTAGRRIMTLTQAFNAREGITPDMYTMPKRLTAPLNVGPAAGISPHYDMLKKSWFEAMSWDIETGMPDKKTLTSLRIDDLING